jgi:hypothetical protein
MRQMVFVLVSIATVAGVIVPGTGHADDQAAPTFVTSIPSGFRDWRVISVAHEEGNGRASALLRLHGCNQRDRLPRP